MHKSFTIKNFRCFSDLTLKPLEQINLITGKNNIGKTAFLEALWIHHGYHNPGLGMSVDAFRGLNIIREDEIMMHIFKEFDQKKDIVLESINTHNRRAKLTISKKEHSTITVPIDIEEYKKKRGKKLSISSELTMNESTGISRPEILFEFSSYKTKKVTSKVFFDKDKLQFEKTTKPVQTLGIYLAATQLAEPDVTAERFGNITVNKAEEDIIQILKIIEPDLQKLIVRVGGGAPIIYGDTGKKKMIPLPLMGDGMGRLLRIALAIVGAANGIVLIDEIENGLHYTVIKNVWKAIAQLSRKYKTQIFATTHSRECIQSAYEAFNEDKKYDFLLHRLELVKGKITDVVYDKETLEAAIKSKFEIR